MPLSWNEIRHRAIRFSKDWADASSERAEKQTFWNEFFDVFGLRRRVVATFEERVKKLSGHYGFIDLFWPGTLLVEHKSLGEDLGAAGSQAFAYIRNLLADNRAEEAPRYVLVSDFARLALYDLEPDEQRDLPLSDRLGRVATVAEFPLAEFHRHIHAFAFIPGYQQHRFAEQDPINLKAVAILARLHDALEEGGYSGHDLERLLVRVLFCLFAEDTGLFERDAFRLYIENRTAEDGSTLGARLVELFETLNTPLDRRQKHLDETLAAFPYVNGLLFAERLGFPAFNRAMRETLLTAAAFDWGRISPAIFGSLFQDVMQPRERRQIGAHYTSERDILKVVRSLFLDDLRAEFAVRVADRSTARRARLEEFHERLCRLRFLDPACGCGNFLVLTYRELRLLELDVLKELLRGQREFTLDEVNRLSRVNVDQFHGIEIGEWPARIAEVALWLMDHQMNLRVSETFGQLYQRLPLRAAPHIVVGNALRLDWREVLPPAECSYVLGNPPFVGKNNMTAGQNDDMALVIGALKGGGLLDYVTAWYFKAIDYIAGTPIRVGFVSTNSISQGEQPGILWGALFARNGFKIIFGHRTFPWTSEARGKAHVHVVIIGFAAGEVPGKRIYDYDAKGENATVSEVANISPYLVEGGDSVVLSRGQPLCDVPEIVFGNMPNDGGHLLLDREEKAALLAAEPGAAKFLRPFLGSEEFINHVERWCLWLVDATPGELTALPEVRRRIEAVRAHRLKSTRATTRALAAFPALFGEIRQPARDYLLIPSVSSEHRPFIPIGFMPKTTIGSNLVLFIPDATFYHFGVLSSTMHVAWVKQVGGRLKSDYRYSGKVVYNNFPWPESPTPGQRAAVENAARAVLDARAAFPGSTLAQLYDPLTMPPALVRAHAALDRAVDRCYRREAFAGDRQRVEHLFALYERLTAPLLPATPTARGRRSRGTRGQAPGAAAGSPGP